MNEEPRPAPPEAIGADITSISQEDLLIETYQVLEPDGAYDLDQLPDLEESEFCDLYRWMLLQRTFDERATKLQRRGKLGTFDSGKGQEAAIIGSGFALQGQDWIFPYGREAGTLLIHGLSMRDLLLYWCGIEDASRREGTNIFGPAISIGSHVPVVTGARWGLKLDDDAVANIGDGAISMGAFHEGLNFAGVLGVPAVFFCQNNQYAISLPLEKQTTANTVAQKALAYGVDGIWVDGNDVLAVYNAVGEACRRALNGEPVLIEAVTYRRTAHTTSDDPTRYRSEGEVEEWEERDPLERYRTFLKDAGLWGEIDEESIREEVNEEFSAAVEAADAYTEPLGEAVVHVEGEDVTVISWGAMMHKTTEAVDNLDGIDCEVIDLRSVSPLDRETLLELVEKTGRCVVVHEAAKTGGFASEIIATINDDVLMYLEAPINRVTGFDMLVPLLSMEDFYLSHPPRIEEAIKETVEY